MQRNAADGLLAQTSNVFVDIYAQNRTKKGQQICTQAEPDSKSYYPDVQGNWRGNANIESFGKNISNRAFRRDCPQYFSKYISEKGADKYEDDKDPDILFKKGHVSGILQ